MYAYRFDKPDAEPHFAIYKQVYFRFQANPIEFQAELFLPDDKSVLCYQKALDLIASKIGMTYLAQDSVTLLMMLAIFSRYSDFVERYLATDVCK